eukprot:GDKI01009875.1.p1 GENE.GDKI01009875.1~~GDKI01009875.1.p1  ORF type:complete len:453 (-),score=27.25 GDKI01009875.1:104-1462(-)
MRRASRFAQLINRNSVQTCFSLLPHQPKQTDYSTLQSSGCSTYTGHRLGRCCFSTAVGDKCASKQGSGERSREENVRIFGASRGSAQTAVDTVKRSLQQSGCSCMEYEQMREGTLADMAVRCTRKTVGKNTAGVGVQVKGCANFHHTTANRDSPQYSFIKVNCYTGLAMVCIGLDRGVCWHIPGADLTHLKKSVSILAEGGMYHKYKVNLGFNGAGTTGLPTLGQSLCAAMHRSQYMCNSLDYWNTPTSLLYKQEAARRSELQPLLDACGITVTYPEMEGTTTDMLWSCEYIEGLRVQQKSSHWSTQAKTPLQLLKAVVKKSAGIKQGKVKHQPYTQGDFDVLWIPPPASPCPFPDQYASEIPYSHFFADIYTLTQHNIVSDNLTGTLGKTGLLLCTPEGLVRRAQNKCRSSRYNWTAECMHDIRNLEQAAEKLMRTIKAFAQQSGRLRDTR